VLVYVLHSTHKYLPESGSAYHFSCWFSRHFMNKRQPPAADTPNISWKPSNMVHDSEFLAEKVGICTPPSSSADKSEQRQQKRDVSFHLSCLENACSRTLAHARVRPRQSSPSSIPRELIPPLSWTGLIRPNPPLAKHSAGKHAARQSRRGHQTYSRDRNSMFSVSSVVDVCSLNRLCAHDIFYLKEVSNKNCTPQCPAMTWS
jgi:hypothetical protein